MADKISSYGRAGLDISQAKSRSVEKADRAAGSGSENRSEGPRDAVELTDTATNLKRIEARLRETPEVDQRRVEEVRARLQSGEYRVDPDRLAQKLLRLEQDLT